MLKQHVPRRKVLFSKKINDRVLTKSDHTVTMMIEKIENPIIGSPEVKEIEYRLFRFPIYSDFYRYPGITSMFHILKSE